MPTFQDYIDEVCALFPGQPKWPPMSILLREKGSSFVDIRFPIGSPAAPGFLREFQDNPMAAIDAANAYFRDPVGYILQHHKGDLLATVTAIRTRKEEDARPRKARPAPAAHITLEDLGL